MQQANLITPGGPLPYTIKHRARVTRRLHLELDDNGGLVVVVPAHWSKRLITRTMKHNAPRIERFLKSARSRYVQPLRYIDGEKHLYLGEAYSLAVHVRAGQKKQVAIKDQEIHVWATSPANTQAVMRAWYRRQAGLVFQTRLAAVSRRAPWTHGKQVDVVQRRMKRTWGNCSPGGLIKLNTQLVKAPVKIIDAVIAHELCHLQEMNHSAAFYALLECLNPGWREDRDRLRSEGSRYLA